jgi:hypothetical protein
VLAKSRLSIVVGLVALGLAAGCTDRVDQDGIVVDRSGGTPLGGVVVAATPIAGAGDEAPVKAVSRADGSFQLEGLSRAATYRLVATSDSYADAAIEALTPSDSPVRIETFRATGLRGRVLDSFSEAPIAGARVIAVPRGDPEGKARTRVVITDADGRFGLFETRPAALRGCSHALPSPRWLTCFQRLPLVGCMASHAPSSRKPLKTRRWRVARSEHGNTL